MSLLATGLATVGLSSLIAVLLPSEPDWIPHLATHASIGVPVLVLACLGWRERAQKRLGTSAGPTIALVVLSIIGAAQVIEAASAWVEYPQMGALHGGAGALTTFGIVVGTWGLVVLAGSLIFRTTPPRWVLIAGGILLSAVTLLVIRTLVGF